MRINLSEIRSLKSCSILIMRRIENNISISSKCTMDFPILKTRFGIFLNKGVGTRASTFVSSKSFWCPIIISNVDFSFVYNRLNEFDLSAGIDNGQLISQCRHAFADKNLNVLIKLIRTGQE